MLGIDVAKQYLGLQERDDRSELMSLLRSKSRGGDINIDPSRTPWCAAFVNFCERSVGNSGSGRLNAQSFRTYGSEVEDEDWQRGDIVVFHFPSDSPANGHVTYIDSWNDTAGTVTCLGGNQHDSVEYSTYSQEYVQAVRRYKGETD